MFEVIKQHHIDTFDSDAQYQSGQLAVESFDATDILAHKDSNSKPTPQTPETSTSLTLPRPYQIGSSTTYASNAISGTTQGSRILKDVLSTHQHGLVPNVRLHGVPRYPNLTVRILFR